MDSCLNGARDDHDAGVGIFYSGLVRWKNFDMITLSFVNGALGTVIFAGSSGQLSIGVSGRKHPFVCTMCCKYFRCPYLCVCYNIHTCNHYRQNYWPSRN